MTEITVVLTKGDEELKRLTHPHGARVASNICRLGQRPDGKYSLQHAKEAAVPLLNPVDSPSLDE